MSDGYSQPSLEDHLEFGLQPNHTRLRPRGQKERARSQCLRQAGKGWLLYWAQKSGKPEHACSELRACSTHLLEERAKSGGLNWDAAVSARASSGSSSSTKFQEAPSTFSIGFTFRIFQYRQYRISHRCLYGDEHSSNGFCIKLVAMAVAATPAPTVYDTDTSRLEIAWPRFYSSGIPAEAARSKLQSYESDWNLRAPFPTRTYGDRARAPSSPTDYTSGKIRGNSTT
jgi:hypothetical protein